MTTPTPPTANASNLTSPPIESVTTTLFPLVVDGGQTWRVASSSDPAALAVVDGTGRFVGYGPHYSRRTPGSKTFTGVGQELVLITESEDAVWAVVRQKTPARRGSGTSRGRNGESDRNARYIWRNMLFRNLSDVLTSQLIREATTLTYQLWPQKYGSLPTERLRTEIEIASVRSTNPGYCYKCAGYTKDRIVRGKLYLWAPDPPSPPFDTAPPPAPTPTPPKHTPPPYATMACQTPGTRTMPARRLCLDCPNPAEPGTARCARCNRAHQLKYRGRNQLYRGDWPQQAATRIAAHRRQHGDICPGYGIPAHPINPKDWTCDHDLGPLCRPCNSRKAATTDRARRRRPPLPDPTDPDPGEGGGGSRF